MAVPDPKCFIMGLEYDLHQTLCTRLGERNTWRLVAQACGIFTEDDITRIETPTKFLIELNNRYCTVDSFCCLLRRCQLYHILALLKEPEPIVITTQPSLQGGILLGEDLKLQCEATGLPLPQYAWYLENKEIPGQTTETLWVQNFNIENEGNYYCCVSQPTVGNNTKVTSTMVHVEILPEAPSLSKQPPKTFECQKGDEITISCDVRGYPPPTFEWIHRNKVLPYAFNSKLTLDCAEIDHSGEYRCFARNRVGEIYSDTTNVVVHKYSEKNNDIIRNCPVEKIALLIANVTYKESKLRTPTNDVATLAKQLVILGFKVISLKNLTLNEMKNMIDTFCQLLPLGAYALFYFAGHGFEMGNKYMLPVDAPGLNKYLRVDSLCETEVICEVLKTKPQLFVILLDMCLKVPNKADNPGIHDEVPVLIQYTPDRILVQGYATTSNLAAYERKNDLNGIYMKHLEKVIMENDLPVSALLDEVARRISKDVTDVAEKQMPSHLKNVVESFYLSDEVKGDERTDSALKNLNYLPSDTMMTFHKVETSIEAQFTPYLCFHNALQINMSKIPIQWCVTCCVFNENSDENDNIKNLKLDLLDNVDNVVVTVHNLQKIKVPLKLKISLSNRETKHFEDDAILELGLPLIAAAK